MGWTLQLLLRPNILPRCWEFWVSKGFRILSNSHNFGADILSNMSFFRQGVVTRDALVVQSHVIPATICPWLHSQEKYCSRLRSRSEMTEHLPLWPGSAETAFSSFSISTFPSLHVRKTKYETHISFQARSFTLQGSLWMSIWAVFAFAEAALCLCSNEIQLGKVTAVQGQGETEILLCFLTNMERSPMSHVEVVPMSNYEAGNETPYLNENI